MPINQTQQIITGIVILVLAGLALWIFGTRTPAEVSDILTAATSTSTNATSTSQATSTAAGGVKPAATSGTSAAANKAEYDAQMNAGNAKYRAGDYAGARTIWEAVAKKWPNDAAVHMNLAELYTKRIVNYPLAETHYLAAIRYTPAGYSAGAYRALYDFYTYQYKQGPAQIEIVLKEGVQKNPKAVELYVLLARLYKDAGRTAEAKAQYDAAITAAGTNADLAATLRAERDSF